MKSHARVAGRLFTDVEEDVSQFLAEHSLAPDFSDFVKLAVRSFPNVVGLTAMPESDPDDQGAEWITLQLRVEDDVERALQHYEEFIEQSMKAMPAGSRALLRLSLDIV